MKHRAACLLMLLVTLAVGCTNREEELRGHVAQLEGELAQARLRLEEGDAAIGELRQRNEQNQAALDALTVELVKVKVERDQLKQEVAALTRKRR